MSNALVGGNHYTTYPYTSDAVFSILTGRYPGGRNNLLRRTESELPAALGTELKTRGYETRIYAPYADTFEDDAKMFRLAGFPDRYVAERDQQRINALPPEVTAALTQAKASFESMSRESPAITRRLTLDLLAFERLKADVIQLKTSGKRFVSIIMPQIGHGPWPDLHARNSVLDRGIDILSLQDRWIQEIYRTLDDGGWLASTVLVIVADHGIRTKSEDPALLAGRITDYSFRVPILYFSKKAFDRTHIVAHPTSHIDVAPSILSLLGIAHDDPRPTGQPLWCSGLKDRRVFLFASGYFGSDGVLENGVCHSYSRMAGLADDCPGIGKSVSESDARASAAERIVRFETLTEALNSPSR
jgi:membrane-anchored protein YejM (alkaline phosphatase superfamily)